MGKRFADDNRKGGDSKRPRRGKRGGVGGPPSKSALMVAKQALSVARQNAVTVERKRYDSTGNTTADDAGVTLNLANIMQGTGETNRVGTLVAPKRIQLACTINTDAAAAYVTNLRMVICCKKAPGDFVAAEYFQNTTSAQELTSHREWDNMRHYSTLYDELITLNDGAGLGNFATARYITVDIPKSLQRMRWDSAGAREGNSLWAYFISNQATNKPIIFYSARCIYTDA